MRPLSQHQQSEDGIWIILCDAQRRNIVDYKAQLFLLSLVLSVFPRCRQNLRRVPGALPAFNISSPLVKSNFYDQVTFWAGDRAYQMLAIGIRLCKAALWCREPLCCCALLSVYISPRDVKCSYRRVTSSESLTQEGTLQVHWVLCCTTLLTICL